MKLHIHAIKALDGEVLKPKHHSLMHMVPLIWKSGTPHMWSNWRDEKENLDLKRVALRAHRSVWALRVLSEHRRAWGIRSRKRKTSRR